MSKLPTKPNHHRVVGAVALGVFAIAVGCTPGSFEDRRDQAWSDSNSAPDNVAADDYGVAVSSVATGRAGMHLSVAGNTPASIATVSYDEGGGLTQSGTTLLELSPAEANLPMPPTIVASKDDITGADGLVAIGGLGDAEQILLYEVRTGGLGPEPRRVLDASLCGGDLPDLGRVMAFGRTSEGAINVPDLVASSGAELVIFVDVNVQGADPTCYRCTLAGGEVYDMEIGELWDGGPYDGDEVWMAYGGGVTVFNASLIEFHDTQDAPCFTQNTPQISGLGAAQGARLAIGSATSLEGLDLAVSNPAISFVEVYRNMTASGPGGPQQILQPEVGASRFGASLAFGDLDGDDRDELIIGDPTASPEDALEAGRVEVYSYSEDDGFERRAILYDSSPESEQHFGRALEVAEFVTGTGDDADVLVVGASGEVFAYFRALVESVDPRQ